MVIGLRVKNNENFWFTKENWQNYVQMGFSWAARWEAQLARLQTAPLHPPFGPGWSANDSEWSRNQSINQSINQCFIVFHDVLMMYLWCTYDVLMMYLWCFMFSQFIIVYHLLIIGKCWMIRWWTTEGLGGIRNENMQKTHFQTPFSGDTLKLVFHWRWIFMFPLPLLLGHRCWSRISRKTNLSGGFLKSGWP